VTYANLDDPPDPLDPPNPFYTLLRRCQKGAVVSIVFLPKHGHVRRMPRIHLLVRVDPVKCLIDRGCSLAETGRDQFELSWISRYIPGRLDAGTARFH
jgi:hypothetical protein